MAHWLFKSEPGAYAIADLKADGTTGWSGVRNYQARNFMLAMRVGDLGFFYHSNANPTGVAGIVEVVREAYPDHTALDPASPYFDAKATAAKPIWQMVDVAFGAQFAEVVTLERLRATAGLEQMPLLQRGSRLSVLPVSPGEWEIILKVARLPSNDQSSSSRLQLAVHAPVDEVNQ
ncbi:MAG: EVE domain-containing protein [Aphanocapsa lilacina HA4352-LM1]|jgi:predicted RNA-binding protein with PUA-like domain|nr:EVE domain-containing protein [Aphanocapsa lilacina HA4352-LM1]